MDYLVLKTEILTDPATLGYQPFIDIGNDQAIAELLNSLTDVDTLRKNIKREEIFNNIIFADYLLLSDAKRALLSLIFQLTDGEIDATNSAIQEAFAEVFGNTSTTYTQLTVMATRKQTRAEVVLGVNIPTITSSDVAQALRGV